MADDYDLKTALADLGLHDGYVGAFSRSQAPGAIRNGATVVKQNSEPKDGNRNGERGVVLGSIYIDEPDPRFPDVKHIYWVEWTRYPRHATLVVDRKVRAA